MPPTTPGGVVLLVDLNNNGVYDDGDDVMGSPFSGDCDDTNNVVQGPRAFYVDEDGDTWGSTRQSPVLICPNAYDEAPAGFTSQVGDCVDSPDDLATAGDFVDPQLIYPGVEEDLTDGQDNNCDGFVDNENASIQWYLDADGDGYGKDVLGGYSPGAVTVSGDCDDTSTSKHPAHPEICDGVANNDCNPSTPDPELDLDGDGFSPCNGDPNDTEPSIGPDLLTWYQDVDGDGYGGPTVDNQPTRPGPDWVLLPGDCDDTEVAINPAVLDNTCDGIDDDCDGIADEAAPTSLWFADFDGDGQGDTFGIPFLTCTTPTGFVSNNDDCDDTEFEVKTGATEICDGVDNDCDGVLGGGEIDVDGDGWLACDECDDANGARNPGEPEVYDGVPDNDCDSATPDPEVDADGDGYSFCEGDPDDSDDTVGPSAFRWYEDSDGDGFGGTNTVLLPDAPGPTWTLSYGDCDDGDATIHPSADDITCDGIDQDCDDEVPVDALSPFYPDADGDGEGREGAAPLLACTAPAGFVQNDDDCDDVDALINTAATEICDGIDNNCDGVFPPDETTDGDGDGYPLCMDCDDGDPDRYPTHPEVCDGVVDNNCSDPTVDIEIDADGDGLSECEGDPDDTDAAISATLFLWFSDGDGDGFGIAPGQFAALPPTPNSVVISGDCDDTAPLIYPTAIDNTCDGVDQDCSGDDANDGGKSTYYLDADNDGYGRLGSEPLYACVEPAGYVLAAADDCDDLDDTVHPGATELCDGKDTDCVGGFPAEETTDGDTDGYVQCEDCQDDEQFRNPGMDEICDGIVDNNCDGDPNDIDADIDGDGASQCDGDPNDFNASITAPEVVWYFDDDDDGWGGFTELLSATSPGLGWTTQGGDCEDNLPLVHPGVTTDGNCDLIDDDCDGFIDEDSSPIATYYFDNDGDTYGDPSYFEDFCATNPPTGWVLNNEDCDDWDANTYPGATELCDGLNNDCDLPFPADELDNDGDGVMACGGDCDDDNMEVYPGNPLELCDGIDNNCDGGSADFGYGPTFDVANPSQGVIVETLGGDLLVGMNDFDVDNIPSVADFVPLCEEIQTGSHVQVTYTNGDPAINIFPFDGVSSLINGDDCDTGTTDTAQKGTLYFADRDSDTYPGADSPEDLFLAGCPGGGSPPGDFFLYDPLVELDCDPFEPTRFHEAVAGDYLDFDGDTYVSSRPATADDLNTYLSDDRCVGSFSLTAGPDCNDFDNNPDASVSYVALPIQTNQELNTALNACTDAILDIQAPYISFDGAVQPADGASFTFTQSAPTFCDPYDLSGCLNLVAPMQLGDGTKVTLDNINITGTLSNLFPTSPITITNSTLVNLEVSTNGPLNVDGTDVVLDGALTAFSVTNNAPHSVSFSTSSFTGTNNNEIGISAGNTDVFVMGTSFTNMTTGMIGTSPYTNLACDSCTFSSTGEGMSFTNQPNSSLSCDTCDFFDMTGTSLKASGSSTSLICNACTDSNSSYPFIDGTARP